MPDSFWPQRTVEVSLNAPESSRTIALDKTDAFFGPVRNARRTAGSMWLPQALCRGHGANSGGAIRALREASRRFGRHSGPPAAHNPRAMTSDTLGGRVL